MSAIDFSDYGTFHVKVSVLYDETKKGQTRTSMFQCEVEVYAHNVSDAAAKAAEIFTKDVRIVSIRREGY